MASITQRGKRFVLSWQEKDGRQVRKSLGKDVTTLKQAETIKKAKEIEIETGKKVLTDTSPLFRDFKVEYLRWRATEFPASQSRIKGIVDNILSPEFDYHHLSDISPIVVERFKSRLLSDYVSPYTMERANYKRSFVRTILKTLMAIMNLAVRWKLISENQIRGVRAPKSEDSKPPVWYTQPELIRIYAASLNGDDNIWRLLANTGLRASEAVNLLIENVIFIDDKPVRINVVSETGARTKSGKWRMIPLGPAAQQAILALIERSQNNKVLGGISLKGMDSRFRDTLQRAGLKRKGVHTLRHTFGTQCVLKNIAPRKLQKLMGHASIQTTEIYMHVKNTDLMDDFASFSL